ncbi:MAG: hypothetical protein PHG48_03585 [Eubacteriales bacterium]|nr:hypothetical protein [Eubacteriales bacterium]
MSSIILEVCFVKLQKRGETGDGSVSCRCETVGQGTVLFLAAVKQWDRA